MFCPGTGLGGIGLWGFWGWGVVFPKSPKRKAMKPKFRGSRWKIPSRPFCLVRTVYPKAPKQFLVVVYI